MPSHRIGGAVTVEAGPALDRDPALVRPARALGVSTGARVIAPAPFSRGLRSLAWSIHRLPLRIMAT